MNYIHDTATYSIKVRLCMSCTTVNSNTNVNAGNDMKECTEVKLHTTQRETFEGENFHKFCGFVAIHESFLCENCIFYQFAKVYSLESFPLYSICRNKSNRMLHLDLHTCKRNNNIENNQYNSNHTKHTSRHSISNVCWIIHSNFSVYNSH